jgi:hypothetical protein
MKKLLVFNIVLFFGINNANAQKDKDEKYGIYYTYSGSTYIAKITGETDEDVELTTNDGNSFSLNKFNVRAHIPGEELLIHRKGKYHRTKGFFFNWTLGVGAAGDEDGEQSSSSNGLSVGYYLNKRIALGAGASSDVHNGEINGVNVDNSLIPITAFGRYYLSHNTNRLFAYGAAGYGIAFEDSGREGDETGGFIGRIGLGLHFGSIKKSKFLLKVGYQFQQAGGTELSGGPLGNEIITDYDIRYQRFMIGFSVDFASRKAGYK